MLRVEGMGAISLYMHAQTTATGQLMLSSPKTYKAGRDVRPGAVCKGSENLT